MPDLKTSHHGCVFNMFDTQQQISLYEKGSQWSYKLNGNVIPL